MSSFDPMFVLLMIVLLFLVGMLLENDNFFNQCLEDTAKTVCEKMGKEYGRMGGDFIPSFYCLDKESRENTNEKMFTPKEREICKRGFW